MRRRDFITGIAGSAVAWPRIARAQQSKSKPLRRVAVLMPQNANNPQTQSRNAAFLQALQQLGWTIGQNIQIDYRWSGGSADNTRKDAAELITLAPEVILTSGSAGIAPLLQATRTIPIVFVNVPDPVGSGYVDSLARPGPAATPPVFFCSNTVSAENGWNCSKRSRQK
jgi:putative tryptophan/tyrosine transport system substrate-binding protein